jgi:chemotaxis protein MotB
VSAPKFEEEPEEAEEWLTTYADAITLLMAFFVMLASFSKIDLPLFEQVAAGIKNELGKRDTQSPISLLKIDVQDVVYEMQADQAVNVETTDKGISIELSSSAFYKAGSAEIRDEAFPVMDKIAQTLNGERYQLYNVDVEGHTDDIPINTPRFPSNWELSSARATTVVRFLIDKGIEPERLKATGFAETRPKAENRDAEGKPIKENQSANRRVALEVYLMSLPERSKALARIEQRKRAAEREKQEKEKQEKDEKGKAGPPDAPAPAGSRPTATLPAPASTAQAAPPGAPR